MHDEKNDLYVINRGFYFILIGICISITFSSLFNKEWYNALIFCTILVWVVNSSILAKERQELIVESNIQSRTIDSLRIKLMEKP